jgi:hypothetical protein
MSQKEFEIKNKMGKKMAQEGDRRQGRKYFMASKRFLSKNTGRCPMLYDAVLSGLGIRQKCVHRQVLIGE